MGVKEGDREKVTGPKIKERFIYTPSFKGRKVRMLNSDGYLDFAHQMGVISIDTNFISTRETTKEVVKTDEFGNTEFDENKNPIMITVTTRYALFKATVVVRGKDGNPITATAWREASDKDSKAVHEPWHLIAVAETRAIKAAIEHACCITEELISPGAKAPTRETSDLDLEGDENDPSIPREIRRRPDVTSPLSPPVESVLPSPDGAFKVEF